MVSWRNRYLFVVIFLLVSSSVTWGQAANEPYVEEKPEALGSRIEELSERVDELSAKVDEILQSVQEPKVPGEEQQRLTALESEVSSMRGEISALRNDLNKTLSLSQDVAKIGDELSQSDGPAARFTNTLRYSQRRIIPGGEFMKVDAPFGR